MNDESKTKLNWGVFTPLFGSWSNKFKAFFDEGGFDPIYAHLKNETKRGKTILPDSNNVFRCFTETPFEDLKLVICGFSPYHSMKNNESIADGLCMSCSITNYPQPSLTNFYNAIEKELYDGLTLNHIKNPDLSYLAHQGVLLLNASLTVEYLKPGSHCSLWEPFMKYLFEEVLSGTGVPVVFLGQEAAKLEKYVNPFGWIFKVSHPASISYSGVTDWDSQGLFKSINKVLKDSNNFELQWLDV